MKKLYYEVFEEAPPEGIVGNQIFTKTKVQVGEIPAGCDVKLSAHFSITVQVQSVNSDKQPVGNPVEVPLTINPNNTEESFVEL